MKTFYYFWFGRLATFEGKQYLIFDISVVIYRYVSGDPIPILTHLSTIVIRNNLQKIITRYCSFLTAVYNLCFVCYVIFLKPNLKETAGFLTVQVTSVHVSISFYVIFPIYRKLYSLTTYPGCSYKMFTNLETKNIKH